MVIVPRYAVTRAHKKRFHETGTHGPKGASLHLRTPATAPLPTQLQSAAQRQRAAAQVHRSSQVAEAAADGGAAEQVVGGQKEQEAHDPSFHVSWHRVSTDVQL